MQNTLSSAWHVRYVVLTYLIAAMIIFSSEMKTHQQRPNNPSSEEVVFQLKMILIPKGHLAMSGDVVGCLNSGWVSAKWHLESRAQRCNYTSYSAQYVHLMRRAVSLEKTLMLGEIEGRRRGGCQRMRWLDRITNSVDIEQTPRDSRGQRNLACLVTGQQQPSQRDIQPRGAQRLSPEALLSGAVSWLRLRI